MNNKEIRQLLAEEFSVDVIDRVFKSDMGKFFIKQLKFGGDVGLFLRRVQRNFE